MDAGYDYDDQRRTHDRELSLLRKSIHLTMMHSVSHFR